MQLRDWRCGWIAGRAKTEASGGVTLANVRAIAETGVDFISVGAITHSARAVDIALDFEIRPLMRKFFRAARAGDGVSGAELSKDSASVARRSGRASRICVRLVTTSKPSPHLGYRLISVPDVLHADDLLVAHRADSRVIGRDIRVFEQTTSTNDIAELGARWGQGRRGDFCGIAKQRTGTAGSQLDFAAAQRTLVFHFVATEYAAAGGHAIDRCGSDGVGASDSAADGDRARNQMAE